MNSQYNTLKVNGPINLMLSMLIAVEYMVATYIEKKHKLRKMKEMGTVVDLSTMPKTWELVVYYVPSIMVAFNYTAMNLMFLNIALVDIVRRNYQMMLLSSSLEINFQLKNGNDVRLPTLNFIDPKTMTAWMEARKMVLNIGARFIIRIQFYLGVYLALAGLGTFFIVFVILGYVKVKLTLVQWICISTIVGILDIYCVLIMFPYSYINEQSRWQLKRLLFLKSILQRITHDETLIGSNA